MVPSRFRSLLTLWTAAWVCAVSLVAAQVIGGLALAQPASGKLAATDIELPAIPWLVLPTTWEGRPAVMAFTRNEAQVPGTPGGPRLIVLGLRSGAWTTMAAWPLPEQARWIEPLKLAGGEVGWLLIAGQQYQIGRVRAGTLTWQPVCTCPSLYALGDPEELGTRLARDMDGDGVDEVILPTPRGLSVYRVDVVGGAASAGLALEPVALLLWQPDGKPLPRPATAQGPEAPDVLPWQSGRSQQLLRTVPGGFMAMGLGTGAAPVTPLTLNAATRAKAKAGELPAPALAILARLPDGEFKSTGDFVQAFGREAADAARLADVPSVVSALLNTWREVPPEPFALPGLAPSSGDRGYLLALEDLTGDEVPDLVYGVIRNESQILNTESELFYLRGLKRSPLAFAPPQSLRVQGPSAGAVLRTGPKEHILLVARTEASLGAVFRALSTHELTVETTAYALSADGLGTRPLQRVDLTFKGFEEGSQVLVVPANIDGTGRSALLMNLRPDAISLFGADASGPDLKQPAATLSGPIPRKREEVLVGDWEGEGRESLLFWYRGKKYSPAQRRTLRLVRWAASK